MADPVRTLFLTKKLPYPPMGGAPLRNWQNINIMMNFGPVAVFAIVTASDEWNLSNQAPPGVVLWQNYNVKDMAEQRFPLEKLRHRMWRVVPYGHPDVDGLYADSVGRELDYVLTKFQPHLVILEELWLHRYLSVVKRHKCRIIFDDHNIEAPLLRQRHRPAKSLRSKFLASLWFTKIEAIERDFVRQVDQVWVCSEPDAQLLNKLYGQMRNIRVVPNGVNVAYYDCVRLGQCSLPSRLGQLPWTFLFAASFSYEPNVVAAQLLINQIYPRLRQLYPNCHLILVGRNPTPQMQEAAKQDSQIVVTGQVEDVRPYLSTCSVVVVPLLQGGGTRLKILEAFAAGCPVVSTDKGAEGLKVQDGKHLLIRNEIEDIVAGVHKIWSEPSLGQTLIHSAYEFVKLEYSWDAVSQKVAPVIQELL